ncbi:MAG: hypothetical protein CMD05_02620 [Flavobacteriales bacterium]|nr:hypothetical protein [Flavobacteriales bacterium]
MKKLFELNIYFKKIFVLLFLYSLSRLFFLINNISSFKNFQLIEFLEGVRFDISSIAYINIPILLLLIIPVEKKNIYKKIVSSVFYCTNIPFIILNNIDIEYFKFTQKRITYDFFEFIQLGNDFMNLAPLFLMDYWHITLFTIFQIWFIFKINFFSKKNKYKFSLYNSAITLFLGSIFFIVAARGGLQYKPIKPINAGEISKSDNSALILNTPFCIFHSLNSKSLSQFSYYDNEYLNDIYKPIILNSNQGINNQNIVILIMESFSKEFMSFNTNAISYTPFIDSLMKHSLVFNNAFSNGLKSIEALPAITASIPTLMNNPFITSEFAQNKFMSIASLLNAEGYSTSFFHGGIKGTMGFNSYCIKAGYKSYIGMEEYNNKKDFDNSWGIYDEPFLKFTASKLKNTKKPFFTTIFTLSSHPPYTLPIEYIKNKKIDKLNIQETIKYTDYSLSKFFNRIKNEDWFENTIFIITSDHTTPVSYDSKYNNLIGRYSIPLIIYKPDNSLKGENNNIIQQIDIMPTVLELLNYNKTYFAFGKSYSEKNKWAIMKLEDIYYFITDHGIIKNKEEEYITFSDWDLSKKISTNHNDVKLLKAIKQVYSNRMNDNNLIYEN